MKKLFLFATTLIMALAVPVMTSCSDDDDDNNGSSIVVNQYSPKEADAYIKQNLPTILNFNKSSALNNLSYVQGVVHHFRDVYEKYEPVDANVTAQNVLSDLYEIALKGDVNFVEFFEKYKDVKGAYTANDNTKKWEKTGDDTGITLNFKEQNGKDVRAHLVITDSRNSGSVEQNRIIMLHFSLTGGNGLDIKSGAMFTIGETATGSIRTQFGKVRTVKSVMVSQKSLNVSTAVIADGQEVFNNETYFVGDNCMATLTGGLSSSSLKQVESTTVLGSAFVHRLTCSDLSQLRAVRTATYNSEKDKYQARVDFRNKYIKQQVFDNKYKLLCNIEYELGSSKVASGSEYPSDNGTAYFLKSIYKYGNGNKFDLVKVTGVDSEQMYNTIETFVYMFLEAKSHYNLTKAAAC